MTVDFSRRTFLKGSFAFGGLMATGALPALADDPLLFPQRGRWERLSIVSHHIKAGASKPFAILHISDTHLTAAYPDESEAIRNRAKTRSITFGGNFLFHGAEITIESRAPLVFRARRSKQRAQFRENVR